MAEAIREDVRRRRIILPAYEDLKRPLRSSSDGQKLQSPPDIDRSSTLINKLISSIILEPVNFDILLDQITSELCVPKKLTHVTILNFGPGKAVSRALTRGMSSHMPGSLSVTMVDHSMPSISKDASPNTRVAQEPIAIVGMAANFPGAKDASALWEILDQGINTVSEVRYESLCA